MDRKTIYTKDRNDKFVAVNAGETNLNAERRFYDSHLHTSQSLQLLSLCSGSFKTPAETLLMSFVSRLGEHQQRSGTEQTGPEPLLFGTNR